MCDNAMWEAFIDNSLSELRKIIAYGYASEIINYPVLDPFTSFPELSQEWSIDKGLPGEIYIKVHAHSPVLTGLKSVFLSSKPTINYQTRTLLFGLGFDKLIFFSPDFALDSHYKFLSLKKEANLANNISITAEKVNLELSFKFDFEKENPSISAYNSNCSYKRITPDFKYDKISVLLLPWLHGFIEKNVSNSIGKIISAKLTEDMKTLYSEQKLFVDKIDSLYKIKVEQGGWEEGKVPRIFQGFYGIGELPLPSFWKLPVVNVNKLPHISVESIVDSCCTGDIILFSGTDQISQNIRRVIQSPFSHCIMVIKDEHLVDGKALAWQATINCHQGVLRDMKYQPGIQLNLLNDMVSEYLHKSPGSIAVYRKLSLRNCNSPNNQASNEGLINFVKLMDGKPFSSDMDGLYEMGLLEVKPPYKQSFFCSGLVAESLMILGVLDRKYQHYQYAPRDFSALQNHLPYTNNSNVYGKESVIILE